MRFTKLFGQTCIVALSLVVGTGLAWAQDEDQERREVRVEVRRTTGDEGPRRAGETDDRDQSPRERDSRRGDPDVARERETNARQSTGANRREPLQRPERLQRERAGRPGDPPRDRREDSAQRAGDRERRQLRIEIELPAGIEFPEQLQSVIRELTGRLQREFRGGRRPGQPDRDASPDARERDVRQRHLRTAIEHLRAAGLHEEADALIDRHPDMFGEARRDPPERYAPERRPEGPPPHIINEEALRDLRQQAEERMREYERALEDVRRDGQRRWEEFETVLREQVEHIEREVTRRLEELSRRVEESQRD